MALDGFQNALNRRPDSNATLAILEPYVERSFLLVPNTFVERYSPRYDTKTPPGSGATRLWYSGGGLNTVIDFEIFIDALDFFRRGAIPSDSDMERAKQELREWRWFLEAMVTPRVGRGVQSVSPPKVRLHWPGVINTSGVITSLEIAHEMFFNDLQDRIIVAAVEFTEELVMTRLYEPRDILRGVKERGA